MGLADGPTDVHKLVLAREVLKQHRASADDFPTRHVPRLRQLAQQRYADALADLGEL